jgi:heavy metal sensor kinase
MTSIRARLTAWYCLWLIVILAVFGFGARYGIQRSIFDAVDHDLETRLADLRIFIEDQTRVNPSHLIHELDEHSRLGAGGGPVELWDDSGKLLYRSARVPVGDFGGVPSVQEKPAATTLGSGGRSMRTMSELLSVNGLRFIVRASEPMHEFDETLERFDGILLISAPLLLIAAGFGGYWISGRALAPVDQLTQDARSIEFSNLTRRLDVPPARDELQRLAITLNEMLARIDGAVQRMVQFTADASHELRAPLTLIHTAAEFSLRGDRPREELAGSMQKILRESERMTGLVEDLLTLARADSGGDEVALSQTDLAGMAASAAESVRALAQAKGLKLEVHVPEEPLPVLADEPSFTRLLLILLDNAVKYTDEGGLIEVEVRESAKDAEVSVTDSGIGISSEDLPHIWDRFWRADKVRSRNTGSAGLGLAIARSIAERHGAELDVASELGRGSRFTVRLPRSDKESRPVTVLASNRT